MRKKQKRRQGQEVSAGSAVPALISSHTSQSQEHITLRDAPTHLLRWKYARTCGLVQEAFWYKNQKTTCRLMVVVIQSIHGHPIIPMLRH